jgi:hypothetical protein
MCAVLEDDVSHRMNSLVDDGYYSLFRDLHPEISVEGDRLFVDKPHFDDSIHHASEMILTPSVFAWPNLILQDGTAGQFGLTYAVRGIARVWEGRDAPTVTDAESLAALLGRARRHPPADFRADVHDPTCPRAPAEPSIGQRAPRCPAQRGSTHQPAVGPQRPLPADTIG